MKVKVIITVIFIVALGFFIERVIDIPKVFTLLKTFPLQILVSLLLLSTMILILKAMRFYILLNKTDIDLSFWDVCKISIAGQALSPLPGGELARGVLLKEEKGISFSKSSGILVTQPILELIVSALITLLGGLFFKKFVFVSLLLLGLIALFLFLFLYKPFLDRALELLPEKKFFKKIKEKLIKIRSNVTKTITQRSSLLPNDAFYKCFLIIVLANLVGGLILYIILSSFHLYNMNFLICVFIYSSSIVLQSLSILPGGLGVTEGGMAGIFIAFEIGFAQSFVVILIFRVITFIYSILIGLLFLLFFYSKTLLLKKHGKNKN